MPSDVEAPKPRPLYCPLCSPDHYMASRMDYWGTAFATLDGKTWGEPILPSDVLMLAAFLAGEDIPT